MPSNPETLSQTDLETAVSLAELKAGQESLRQQFDLEKRMLEDRIEQAEQKLDELNKDKQKALIWGITLLGTAVMAMGSWIFRHFEKAVS